MSEELHIRISELMDEVEALEARIPNKYKTKHGFIKCKLDMFKQCQHFHLCRNILQGTDFEPMQCPIWYRKNFYDKLKALSLIVSPKEREKNAKP